MSVTGAEHRAALLTQEMGVTRVLTAENNFNVWTIHAATFRQSTAPLAKVGLKFGKFVGPGAEFFIGDAV